MRKNPHVRICGGLGSATTLVYPTPSCFAGGNSTANGGRLLGSIESPRTALKSSWSEVGQG